MQAINSYNTVCEFVTLSGMRVFVPKLIDSPSYACGIQDNFPMYSSDGEDAVFEPEAVALCLATAQYQMSRRKDLDKSFVRKEACVISPSLNAPRDALPCMRLRDQMWKESIWMPRRKMFEIANRTHNILSISVVPKNPETFQCWYQRRIVHALNIPSSLYECRACQEKEREDLAPKRQMGFLKPFETYSSADYGVDSKIPFEENLIEYPSDIRELVADIPDPSLKRNLFSILTFFYLDPEARSVGLIYHIGQDGFAKVFHKTI